MTLQTADEVQIEEAPAPSARAAQLARLSPARAAFELAWPSIIEQSLTDAPNVTVTGFSTLVVEFARAHSARSIVKGLRAVSDFEWEFQMNNLNRGLAPEIETLYMMSSPKYSFLSSRGVREIASFGGPVAEYVPEQVARRLADMHAAGAI